MPSRNECERARARLQRETPILDHASLLVLQEQAAEYVRESKRRDALEPDELISAVVDAVARGYFQRRLAYQATCAIRGRIPRRPRHQIETDPRAAQRLWVPDHRAERGCQADEIAKRSI